MLLGKLSWNSLPHDPIVLSTMVVVVIGGIGLLALVTRYKLWGYLWKEWFTTVDHKKIGIMYMILGLVMFLRGFADAIMMRLQQAMAFGGSEGLSQRASLRPDLHRAWRDHDLLRGDAVHHRPDELCRAAADRRARRVLPVPQQFQLLDDDLRRGADHGIAVRRRVRRDRLARLSAAVGHRLQPQRRGRLLYLGAADRGRRARRCRAST